MTSCECSLCWKQFPADTVQLDAEVPVCTGCQLVMDDVPDPRLGIFQDIASLNQFLKTVDVDAVTIYLDHSVEMRFALYCRGAWLPLDFTGLDYLEAKTIHGKIYALDAFVTKVNAKFDEYKIE